MLNQRLLNGLGASRWERTLGGASRLAPKRGGPAVLVGTLLICALVLRVVGIDFGRPFVYHPDEWIVAKPALAMAETGKWLPDLYLYPSALIYAERAIAAPIHALTGTTLTTETIPGLGGLPAIGDPNLQPAQFRYVLAGRLLVAGLGTLMVLFVFLSARAVAGRVAGVVAAAAIAVMPLAVQHSHYLATDIPTGTATALTLWLGLEGHRRGWKWLVMSGFAAGIAASTKYNGGFVVVVPLVIHLTTPFVTRAHLGRFIGVSAAILGAAVLGFILLTPAVVLDTGSVLDALRQQAAIYMSGRAGSEGDAVGFHLSILFGASVGTLLALLAAIGAAVAAIRPKPEGAAILAFVIGYFIVVSIPVVRYSRNLDPMLPFVAVLIGMGTAGLLDRPVPVARAVAVATLLAVGLGQAAMTSVSNDALLLRKDTRTVALTWVFDHIPAGSTIAREDYTPQVPPGVYRVGFAGILSNHTIDFYRAIGARYLVASSWEIDRFRTPGSWQYSFYERLQRMKVVYDQGPTGETAGPRILIVDLDQS